MSRFFYMQTKIAHWLSCVQFACNWNWCALFIQLRNRNWSLLCSFHCIKLFLEFCLASSFDEISEIEGFFQRRTRIRSSYYRCYIEVIEKQLQNGESVPMSNIDMFSYLDFNNINFIFMMIIPFGWTSLENWVCNFRIDLFMHSMKL